MQTMHIVEMYIFMNEGVSRLDKASLCLESLKVPVLVPGTVVHKYSKICTVVLQY